jgi:hypothetical protein
MGLIRFALGTCAALLFVASVPEARATGSANALPAITKAQVREAERWLAELGYWTGPVDGVWDAASRHALVAFQKIEGLRRTGTLTRKELDALARATPPRPREASGLHVEVDIGRQVLFLVDSEGKVGNILPISSGSGKRFKEPGYPEAWAITPCGHLEIYLKQRGHRKSPLGDLHNPLYIVGGIAIHGSDSVPTQAASHGCIRIPMFASKLLFEMIALPTPVYIYGCR